MMGVEMGQFTCDGCGDGMVYLFWVGRWVGAWRNQGMIHNITIMKISDFSSQFMHFVNTYDIMKIPLTVHTFCSNYTIILHSTLLHIFPSIRQSKHQDRCTWYRATLRYTSICVAGDINR